jgi:hypothetical protein
MALPDNPSISVCITIKVYVWCFTSLYSARPSGFSWLSDFVPSVAPGILDPSSSIHHGPAVQTKTNRKEGGGNVSITSALLPTFHLLELSPAACLNCLVG